MIDRIENAEVVRAINAKRKWDSFRVSTGWRSRKKSADSLSMREFEACSNLPWSSFRHVLIKSINLLLRAFIHQKILLASPSNCLNSPDNFMVCSYHLSRLAARIHLEEAADATNRLLRNLTVRQQQSELQVA